MGWIDIKKEKHLWGGFIVSDEESMLTGENAVRLYRRATFDGECWNTSHPWFFSKEAFIAYSLSTGLIHGVGAWEERDNIPMSED